MKYIIKVVLLFFSFQSLVLSQGYKTPEGMGANYVKKNKTKKEMVLSGPGTSLQKTNSASVSINSMAKSGVSIIPVEFDKGLGINQLGRSAAKKHLDRELFGLPQYTATYYYTEYDEKYNLVENTYIQIVSDSRWDRVLYGSLSGALKTYSNIKNPGEIAVNSAGLVFVADRGNSKVQVLQITGKEESISLEYLYSIELSGSVSSIAYNDGETPFILSDDYLYIADASKNELYQYKIGVGSAQKETTFSGLKWPNSIVFGRAEGGHTNDLYVIDNYSKRISLYEISEDELIKITELTGQPSQTFSSIESDHFGQIYIADNVNNEIAKYTSNLVFLDFHKSEQEGFSDICIPFGTIKFHGEEKYWAGFDQLLAIQNWTETSGIQRYKLGLAIADFSLDFSESEEAIITQFTATDYSNVRLTVRQNRDVVYSGESFLKPSGAQSTSWDRSTSNKQQATAGNYTLEVEYGSVYDETQFFKSISFYLPLFYKISCGQEDETKAIKKIRGNGLEIDGIKVSGADRYIEYKVSGLDPASQYEIAVEHYKDDGSGRYQNLIIDDIENQEALFISEKSIKSPFRIIDQDSYSDSEIDIVINNPDGGEVLVSNIWIKETGRDFAVNGVVTDIPHKYSLSQNYPNPFNPSTKIKFELPQYSNVHLAIYDILGRKVAELLNEVRDAGTYTIDFNGFSLASGIYFYRLEADNFHQVKRMLLIK